MRKTPEKKHKILSIITINRNNAAGLRKTIESVITQKINFDKIEFLIIDGKSTDESVAVIKEYAESSNKKISSKISFWKSEKDNGIFNAMNKGIKKSTGDFLLFLNSGDYLINNEVLSNIVKTVNSNFDIYYTSYYIVKDGQANLFHLPENPEPDFFTDYTTNHQNTIISKTYFNKYGLYDESLKLHADWLLITEAYYKYKVPFKYIDFQISYYDLTGFSSQNIGSQLDIDMTDEVMKKTFNNYYDLFNFYHKTITELKTTKMFEVYKKYGETSFLNFIMRLYDKIRRTFKK